MQVSLSVLCDRKGALLLGETLWERCLTAVCRLLQAWVEGRQGEIPKEDHRMGLTGTWAVKEGESCSQTETRVQDTWRGRN